MLSTAQANLPGVTDKRPGLDYILASSAQENVMKAYIVITTKVGAARGIAEEMAQLPGVKMADACWGTGDVYSVVEFQAWKDLNTLIIGKLQLMPGVERTETHVAVES
jgi:DNA-binding Lrp family transcriptional regulator